MKCFTIQWRQNKEQNWGPTGFQIRRFFTREQAEKELLEMQKRAFGRKLSYEFRVRES